MTEPLPAKDRMIEYFESKGLSGNGGPLKVAERFWRNVQKGDGCWVWTRARTRAGYGAIGVGQRTVLTHRLSWEIHNGAIPNGLCVLHRCDNPPCCNPDHLFLGTKADNLRDMTEKGRRRNSRRSHDEIRAIRAAHARGQGAKSIARLFGIPRSTARNIMQGRHWRHVT